MPLEWEDSCIALGSVKGFASIPWKTLTILWYNHLETQIGGYCDLRKGSLLFSPPSFLNIGCHRMGYVKHYECIPYRKICFKNHLKWIDISASSQIGHCFPSLSGGSLWPPLQPNAFQARFPYFPNHCTPPRSYTGFCVCTSRYISKYSPDLVSFEKKVWPPWWAPSLGYSGHNDSMADG